MSSPSGFLLLVLENCTITGPHNLSESGPLSLECVTLVVPQSSSAQDRDVWLVIRVNSFEMPISPLSPIIHSKVQDTYTFTEENGTNAVVLHIPPASDELSAQDRETFEVLLDQYGVLRSAETGGSAFPDEKRGVGRLVLVDEEDGQIVGSLGEEFKIREEKSVSAKGTEKDPVIIDIPEDDEREVVVRSISPDDPHILKAAGMLSRGILYATSMITAGMSTAAEKYIAKSTPRQTPIQFSERTKGSIRRVHNVSGKAVAVTAKTTAMIHSYIDHMVDGKKGSSSSTARLAPPYAPQARSGPPPLPPRPGEKSSATQYPAPPYEQGQGQGQQKKPRLLNRILISTDLLLSTLEQAATQIVDSGTEGLSRSVGHKYGPEAAAATTSVGRTVRNVGVVYIDVRGVGRRALIRRAGKRIIKGRIGRNDVVFGEPDPNGIASVSPAPSPRGSPQPETGPGGWKNEKR